MTVKIIYTVSLKRSCPLTVDSPLVSMRYCSWRLQLFKIILSILGLKHIFKTSHVQYKINLFGNN